MYKIETYTINDYPFLQKILFEAVFWSRPKSERPTLEEGLSYSYTKHVLKDFNNRKGDLAVIATMGNKNIGAAFIRYWNETENIRGYISESIPVLVIAVAENHRNKGIAKALIKSIQEQSVANNINEISLCVTKTNIAYELYIKSNFEIEEDIGDSYNMIWKSRK